MTEMLHPIANHIIVARVLWLLIYSLLYIIDVYCVYCNAAASKNVIDLLSVHQTIKHSSTFMSFLECSNQQCTAEPGTSSHVSGIKLGFEARKRRMKSGRMIGQAIY